MTQDEIIELARQAGVRDDEHTFEFSQYKYLERFAKLVAEKEREACAKVCEDYGRAEEMQAIGNDYAQAIRARGQA
jgi:DNA-directed RNA polymerase subunit F